MKRLLTTILACVLMSTATHVFSFENITLVPRVETGLLDYEARLKWKNFPAVEGPPKSFSNKFQTFFSVLRLGATAAWNDLYLDTYYQITTNDDDELFFPEGVAAPSASFESFDGDRQEYAFTLGYSFFDSASVFFGYRHSDAEASGHLDSDYDFKNDALFLGAIYSRQISDIGLLSLSVAYAHLYDADWSLKIPRIRTINADSNGNGVKASASWKGVLSEGLSYSLTIDGFRYEYDDLDDSGSTATLDLKESELAYRIGLSYAF